MEQTAHAPVHNIFAEETLGMADSQTRHAPNACAQFIESKVQFVKNDTLRWLEMEDVSRLVPFASVKRAREITKLKEACQLRIHKAIERRAQEVKMKRDKTQRNRLESTVSVLMGKAVSEDLLAEKFPDTTPDIRQAILPVFTSPSSSIHKYILHTWTNDGDGSDEVYHGLMQKVKKRDRPTVFAVSYWKLYEDIDDCVDYDVKSKLLISCLVISSLCRLY